MKYNDGRATNHEVAEAERRGVPPFRQHLLSVAALIVQCSHGESSVVAHARHRHGLVSVAREEEYRQAPGKWGGVLSVRIERRSLHERDAAELLAELRVFEGTDLLDDIAQVAHEFPNR